MCGLYFVNFKGSRSPFELIATPHSQEVKRPERGDRSSLSSVDVKMCVQLPHYYIPSLKQFLFSTFAFLDIAKFVEYNLSINCS
jgi:hypothetical protein